VDVVECLGGGIGGMDDDVAAAEGPLEGMLNGRFVVNDQ
jgi:hypothetical protein